MSHKEYQNLERIRKANEKWLKSDPKISDRHKTKSKTWRPRKYYADEDFNEPFSRIYVNY